MRPLTLTPLALMLTGCLAAGERDPTRYPWDARNGSGIARPPVAARGAIPPQVFPKPRLVPPQGVFCVVAIEPQPSSGITVGGKAPGIMSCSMPANPKPPR